MRFLTPSEPRTVTVTNTINSDLCSIPKSTDTGDSSTCVDPFVRCGSHMREQ